MTFLRSILFAVALMTAGIMMSPAAHAGDPQIDAAIAAGTVGERIDGYLGVVGEVDASTARKVKEINNKRRAAYEQLASETDTTVAQVARVVGEKQIEKLESNQYFMPESGTWQRK
jgi:uncharacterized protein YdbL (DUF1318 family)